jgi:DNA-binding NarL/FixJ family response regulator
VGTWSRRVLLVEDEPLLASLMGQVLVDTGFDVTCARLGDRGPSGARTFDPDVALIDVHLGTGPAGLYLAHALSRSHPHVGILLLSRYEDLSAAGLEGWDLPEGQRVPAQGPGRDRTALVAAVESVLRGVPAVTVPAGPSDGALAALTRTQLAVLRLAAMGLTNTAIAQRRGTTERNIERRLKTVYDVLGIVTDGELNPRVEAVRRYVTAAGMPSERDTAQVRARDAAPVGAHGRHTADRPARDRCAAARRARRGRDARRRARARRVRFRTAWRVPLDARLLTGVVEGGVLWGVLLLGRFTWLRPALVAAHPALTVVTIMVGAQVGSRTATRTLVDRGLREPSSASASTRPCSSPRRRSCCSC